MKDRRWSLGSIAGGKYSFESGSNDGIRDGVQLYAEVNKNSSLSFIPSGHAGASISPLDESSPLPSSECQRIQYYKSDSIVKS